jgi:hypothetical protein
MNFTESFDQFSSRVSTLDLTLYAGIGLVLWVLFKDKLVPVQQQVNDLIGKFLNKNNTTVAVSVPPVKSVTQSPDDIFFKLVVSWKQTRDLAEKSGCTEAIKVADQMFPYLSPNVCGKDKV